MNLEKIIKYALTIFVIILVPVYTYFYGIENFLWLSDVGLLLTILALWLNSTLLMSMAALGVMVVELAWNVDFFAILLLNINPIGFSNYMFDSSYPLMLRGLSLFHVVTPPIWLWYLAQRGYNKRALPCFTVLFWFILPTTYFLTQHQANINWVFLPELQNWQLVSPTMWVVFLFIGFPLLIFAPTHYVFTRIFKAA